MKRTILSATLALSGLASLVNGSYAQDNKVKGQEEQGVSLGFFNIEEGRLAPNYGPAYKEEEIDFLNNKENKPSYFCFVSSIWTTREDSSYFDKEKVINGTRNKFNTNERIHIGIELTDMLSSEQLSSPNFNNYPELKYELFNDENQLVKTPYVSKITGRIKQVTDHPRLNAGKYNVKWSVKTDEKENEWMELDSINFVVE